MWVPRPCGFEVAREGADRREVPAAVIALLTSSSVSTNNPDEDRPPVAGRDAVPHPAVPGGDAVAEVKVPQASDDVENESRDAEPKPDPTEAAVKAARALASGVVRSSAAGVARGSAAATRGGAVLVERANRVTYWPAALCVLGAILLQIRLPDKLTVGPSWLLPSLEGALLIGLAATTPRGRVDEDHHVRRRVAIGLIALVNAANAASLYLLAHELLHKHVSNGHALILSGVAIWLTNVLIFALWYWQLDRGGPAKRAKHPDPTTPEGHPDFIFPEMDSGLPYNQQPWMPGFVDYLALAVTTATAFSPTDTMPNSQRAKALISTQGLISLITLGLIISRAVGILQ
jgi:hypothetical protein